MPICLVSLPSTSIFDGYYRDIFVKTIERAGLQPVRADDFDKHRAITDQIPGAVFDAAICIFDLTGRSPAVLYALGLAQGMGKPLLFLAQRPEDLPYDLRLGHYILYHPGAARWDDMLSMQLQSAIRETV